MTVNEINMAIILALPSNGILVFTFQFILSIGVSADMESALTHITLFILRPFLFSVHQDFLHFLAIDSDAAVRLFFHTRQSVHQAVNIVFF